MDIDDPNLPVFLGACQRYSRTDLGANLIGVSTLIMLPFYPQTLSGLCCLMGLRRDFLHSVKNFTYRISVTDEKGNEAWNDQTLNPPNITPISHSNLTSANGALTEPTGIMLGGYRGEESEPGIVEIIPSPMPPLFLREPGRLTLDVVVDGIRFRRGELFCGYIRPPPISEEERRAIASRPGAMAGITTLVKCNNCKMEAGFFLQLDPAEPRPADIPAIIKPLDHAPDVWNCKCGNDGMNLVYLKQGLHDAFRRPHPRSPNELMNSFVPLYEAGRVDAIVAEYEHIISTAETEEIIQKFLENHPLFWAFLSPAKILHKPPILTKKKADFGILSTQKVLYLIEIEKPKTQLSNKDDSISAEIMKGANQIKDWEMVVCDHRLALLSELGLKENEVHEIRYILIGGMKRNTNPTGLTKLRRSPLAKDTSFYCFDELGSFVYSISSELKWL